MVPSKPRRSAYKVFIPFLARLFNYFFLNYITIIIVIIIIIIFTEGKTFLKDEIIFTEMNNHTDTYFYIHI